MSTNGPRRHGNGVAQGINRGFPTMNSTKSVVFEAGTYELAFESGTATVYVEHDVTADEIMPAVRELAEYVGHAPRVLAAAS